MKKQSITRKMVAEANHKASNRLINSSSELYNHKESEDTLTLQVSENTSPLIAQEFPLGHELTILGIPIFPLTLTQPSPTLDSTDGYSPYCSRGLPQPSLCRQDQLIPIKLESPDSRTLGATDSVRGISHSFLITPCSVNTHSQSSFVSQRSVSTGRCTFAEVSNTTPSSPMHQQDSILTCL